MAAVKCGVTIIYLGQKMKQPTQFNFSSTAYYTTF